MNWIGACTFRRTSDFAIDRSGVTPIPPASNTTVNNALHAALSMKVTKIGNTAFALDSTAERAVTLTPASLGTAKTVPVVIEFAFPWGTPGQYNDTMGGKVKLSADYTLVQE